MSRQRLPNRRAAEMINYAVRGQPLVANVGFYPDGRIGEVFLVHAGKAGADLNISMLEVGVAVSIALQHGATVDELRAALPRTEDGKAEGAIGQLLDLLAKPQLEAVK